MKYELPNPSGEYLIVSAIQEENPVLIQNFLAKIMEIEAWNYGITQARTML